jgi:hypothetical protein
MHKAWILPLADIEGLLPGQQCTFQIGVRAGVFGYPELRVLDSLGVDPLPFSSTCCLASQRL